MRLLHTADWHLGRALHGASLIEAQAAVLDHLVEVAGSEQPDAIVVAGDIFDRAYPPLDAVALYDDAIGRLAQLKIPLVITSGNHDSPVRLGMHGSVAAAAGVHIRTRPDQIGSPVVVESGDEHLLIYPLPYLDPPQHAALLGADPTHESVLGAAMARVRDDLASRAAGAHVVVVAHGVVVGGRPASDRPSERVERPIDVGGVEAVPRSLFDGVNYVALGHLHRPQQLGDHLRYSGAPLPFGFDEAGEQKSLSLVTLTAGAAPYVQTIPTPQPRPMARLSGTLEELLGGSEHAEAERAWVEATLTDPLRPRAAMEQLRQRFPHILKLEHQPPQREGDPAAGGYAARVQGLAPLAIAEQFVDEVREVAATGPERGWLQEALESVDRDQATR